MPPVIVRYRAVVEYDGGAYHGFQRQVPEQPTIQGEIETALRQIAGRDILVVGAGRTDSGVHARGQVIRFDLAWAHGLEALQRALNANLPADIAIRTLEVARPNFHPRFDARRRVYEYLIYNHPVRSPLRHQGSWHVRQPIDVQRMNEAAAGLIGVHDFATFGQAPQGENTTREVFQAMWQPRDEYLVFTIAANAFLQRMVRSIVASLHTVGTGGWRVEDFTAAFAAQDRSRAAGVAPARGLYLISVTYEHAAAS